MQQLLARVGGHKVHLKPEVESALMEVAEGLVGQALSFGCSMARRRQGSGSAAEDLTLQPADVAAFLEQTWYAQACLCMVSSSFAPLLDEQWSLS